MRGHALQQAAKIGEFFWPVFFAGAVEFGHKRLHAVEARFVKWLKNIERGEQERARTARRVEDGHFLNGVPEGAEQFRAFAVFNHVLRELADVKIERDKFVYVCDFVI